MDDLESLFQAYERRFGPAPRFWLLRLESEQAQRFLELALQTGEPIDETRFFPPPGAKS